MVAPPLLAGATQVTVTVALPATAVGDVGAPGAVVGILGLTELDDVEATEVPELFVAVTVKV